MIIILLITHIIHRFGLEPKKNFNTPKCSSKDEESKVDFWNEKSYIYRSGVEGKIIPANLI